MCNTRAPRHCSTICKPSNQTVNRHRLYNIVLYNGSDEMIYTIRRAEKGFSKKILLLFAVLCPNRIRVQLINCTRVIKTGFYVPSCKLSVVYSRARARTYHYYYHVVHKKSICSNLLSRAHNNIVPTSKWIVRNSTIIILSWGVFLYFLYDNSRESSFKTISLGTYIHATEHITSEVSECIIHDLHAQYFKMSIMSIKLLC